MYMCTENVGIERLIGNERNIYMCTCRCTCYVYCTFTITYLQKRSDMTAHSLEVNRAPAKVKLETTQTDHYTQVHTIPTFFLDLLLSYSSISLSLSLYYVHVCVHLCCDFACTCSFLLLLSFISKHSYFFSIVFLQLIKQSIPRQVDLNFQELVDKFQEKKRERDLLITKTQ